MGTVFSASARATRTRLGAPRDGSAGRWRVIATVAARRDARTGSKTVARSARNNKRYPEQEKALPSIRRRVALQPTMNRRCGPLVSRDVAVNLLQDVDNKTDKETRYSLPSAQGALRASTHKRSLSREAVRRILTEAPPLVRHVPDPVMVELWSNGLSDVGGLQHMKHEQPANSRNRARRSPRTSEGHVRLWII